MESARFRRSAYALILLMLLVAPLRGDEPNGASFERLRATDVDGVSHAPGQNAKHRAVAFVFLLTECPISNGGIPELNKIHRWANRYGYRLYGVISDPLTTRQQAIAHRDEYEIAFPVLFDASGILRRELKPTHAPEAFVLDGNGVIVYRGRIDDQYAELGRKRPEVKQQYLRDALIATARLRKVRVGKTEPIGCRIEVLRTGDAAAAVTYARDIAPIIQQQCVECHRRGEVGPFALVTYDDVRRRGQMIVDVIEQHLMPPWDAAAGALPFRNERRLSSAEQSLIKQWVAAGTPRGDTADLPKPRSFPTNWTLGKPDLELTMEQAYQIPADGPDILQHFVLGDSIRENRMVTAIEVLPGNRRAVHHAVIYFDRSGLARKHQQRDPEYGYRGFGSPGFPAYDGARGWVPGMTAQHLPAGMGRPLHKRSDIVLQLHYHPSGKVQRDQTRIGIHFAKEPVKRSVIELVVSDMTLTIPPCDAEYVHMAEYTAPVDLLLLDAWPHLHFLGRAIKATAYFPDGTRQTLIDVPRYRFSWQNQFVYEKPVRIPRGTRIVVKSVFDNSAENPLNPNSPPRTVYWGEATTDEMAICHFHATAVRRTDQQRLESHFVQYMRRTVSDAVTYRAGIPGLAAP